MRKRSSTLLVAGFLAATLLSGCASVGTHGTDTASASLNNLAPRQYHDRISISGRLSANYEANYRQQTATVSFSWNQTPDQTQIDFSSPTGQTVATILINAQGAQFIQADKPPRFAANVDQLSTEVLGWPLPVSGLRNWLQGFLTDQHNEAVTQTNAKPNYLLDGWTLQFVSWNDDSIERPKRIDLQRQTELAGFVSLRIVMDNWSIQ